MRSFINPEVKKSSVIGAILILIFILAVNIVLSSVFNDIKISYVDNKAAYVGELVKSHPELEGEIVNSAFKDHDKSTEEFGKSIIKDYGYSDNIDYKFIDLFQKVFSHSRGMILLTILAFGIVILILNYSQYEFIYKRIRNLTRASKEILEDNYSVNIYEEEEGDFSKLAYGFKNMRSVIKNQMVDLNREKEFLVNILSDISHQLKTPLAALIVYNDILSRDSIDVEDRKQFVESSKKQLSRMEWLIKSLLKLAKVDARAIEFNLENNKLEDTLQEVIDTVKVMAGENHVKLKLNNNIQKNVVYKYDSQWISEAIINIVKNGIEHSRGGQIEIGMEDTPINSKIIIKDNGQGIKSEDLPNIFKRFYKIGKSESVGIGLSLSKAIVEAHGGYIEVSSEVGVGTEFRIILLK